MKNDKQLRPASRATSRPWCFESTVTGFVGLLAIAVATYFPAWHSGGFVWDDNHYVVDNQTLRSADGLWQIWTDTRATPQYYPLVHSTYWLEYQLWGLKAERYHATNVGLHALSALLLWWLLGKLGVPLAWLAAAIFAVHPVHVESVAWITERKNVLSGVFYFAALLSWLKFAPLHESPDVTHRRWPYYGLTIVFFAAALLSKSVTATLPAAILVIVWWKQGRIRLADVRLVAPMFVLGIAAGLHTAMLERDHVGAAGPEWDLSFLERGLIAGRALWFYPGKLLWPYPLAFFYERWEIDTSSWWQYVLLAAAICVPVSLWILRDRLGRGPLAAVLLFGGTLLPALGFVNVYPMRYSFVADHFQYLASVPLIVLFTSIVYLLIAHGNRSHLSAAAAIVLIVLGSLTCRQASNYRDIKTLWLETIAKNPGAWAAHSNLGLVWVEENQLGKAKAAFYTAMRINPQDPVAQYNYGWTLHLLGDSLEGWKSIRKSLDSNRLQHRDRPLFMLATVSMGLGDLKAAIACYRQLVGLRGEYEVKSLDLLRVVAAHNNLAGILATHTSAEIRDGAEAVELAKFACEQTSFAEPTFLDTLASAYAEVGDFDRAIDLQEKAVRLAIERDDKNLARQLEGYLKLYRQKKPLRIRF